MLKRWLDEKKVEYTDYLVDKNPYAAQMMQLQGGEGGVPFSTVALDDGTVEKIVGFDRARFEALMNTV